MMKMKVSGRSMKISAIKRLKTQPRVMSTTKPTAFLKSTERCVDKSWTASNAGRNGKCQPCTSPNVNPEAAARAIRKAKACRSALSVSDKELWLADIDKNSATMKDCLAAPSP